MSNHNDTQVQILDGAAIANEGMRLASQFREATNERLNIFVVGQTGAGKSTLINAVFGADVAPTGSGRPVTQSIVQYRADEILSLYDTKGLEIKDNVAISAEIERFLSQRQTGAVAEQIHIAWLCVPEPSRRIQDAELELYALLRRHNIPTILAITKAERDKDERGEKFSELVAGELARAGFAGGRVLRVRALEVEDDEGGTKPVKGLKELIEATLELLPEAQKNAFARKQIHDEKLRLRANVERARSLITRYTVAAGGVAASPIPMSDIALLLPTQCAMIVHISRVFGLSLNAESAKKLALAFGAVVGAGFAARWVAANLAKFIPGIGTLAGGAINVGVASTVTKLMGEAYIAFLSDNLENLDRAVAEVGKDAIAFYFDKVKGRLS